MSILTEEDIRAAGGIVHRDGNVFFTSVEKLNAAVLAKLAGMELPQHYALIGKEERVVTETFVMEGTHYEKVYTAAQLHQAFAQGAASQLSAEPVGQVFNDHELSDEWLNRLPIGAKLYTLKEPK